MLPYQILACTIHEKMQKSHTRAISVNYQLEHGLTNLNYLMDHILSQIFKIILSIYLNKTDHAKQSGICYQPKIREF